MTQRQDQQRIRQSIPHERRPRWSRRIAAWAAIIVAAAALPLGASAQASEYGEQSSTARGSSTINWDQMKKRFSLNYFNILYGPAVSSPTSYQPTWSGVHDPNRPVLLKNFLTLAYSLNDTTAVSAAAYWMYVPVQGQELLMKDPYIRIANSAFISSGPFNLYSDLRVHLPVTWESRQADLLAGLQTFQSATYQLGASRFTAGLYFSGRLNVFGGYGYGDDVELYLGPNINYQVSPRLSAQLLYEIGSSHVFGEPPFHMSNDGTDIEPGLSWDISPDLNFSPYLNILTGRRGIDWGKTSFGMTLSWMIFGA